MSIRWLQDVREWEGTVSFTVACYLWFSDELNAQQQAFKHAADKVGKIMLM